MSGSGSGACGVCRSDSATVEGVLPIQWPRVPGHEAVGRTDVVGEGVEGWTVGQRVGIGFLGGACGYCEYCRDGDLVNCVNQGYTGVQHDGGYAEMIIAKASGLIAVPEDHLGRCPLHPCCGAGLTTFSALRKLSGARARDLVAVFGVGGLGRLGVQYSLRQALRSLRSTGATTAPSCQRSSARITTSTAQPPTSPRRFRSVAGRRSSWRLPRAAKPSPPPSAVCGVAAW